MTSLRIRKNLIIATILLSLTSMPAGSHLFAQTLAPGMIPQGKIPQARPSFDKFQARMKQQMVAQQQEAAQKHAKYVKNYKPTKMEHVLSWGHGQSQQFQPTTHMSMPHMSMPHMSMPHMSMPTTLVSHYQPEKESFWKKMIKLPYHIGSAILSPVQWVTNNIATPLLAHGIHAPTGYAVNKFRQRLIPDEKLQKMDDFDRQSVGMLTQGTTSLASMALGQLAQSYTNNLINTFAQKLLEQFIAIEDLPPFAQNPTAYKNEVVRRLFEKFEPNLPQSLKNGQAYALYLKGQRIYGHAKLVYDVVDNTTQALSLCYQFTHHAQIHGQSPPMMTKLKKTIMVIDVFRRCADSYLKVVKHFGMASSASQGVKKFQKWLSVFVGIANVVCPWRNLIVGGWETGKNVYKMKKLLQRPKREMVAFLQGHYEMTKADAEQFYDALKKSKKPRRRHITIEKRKRRISERDRERNRREALETAKRILQRYGIDFKTFYYEFNDYNTPYNQMARHLIRKYKLQADDANKLIACWQTNNQEEQARIFEKYKLSQEKLDRDEEVKAITMNLMIQAMSRRGQVV